MRPAAIIKTYMRWREWKWLPFNIALFIWQILFMVMGTIYGKIKWPKPSLDIRIVSIIGIVGSLVLIFYYAVIFIGITLLLFYLATLRGIDWRKVWRAAQVCHVRLCLKMLFDNLLPIQDSEISLLMGGFNFNPLNLLFNKRGWEYISFGYPKAKLECWRRDMIDGKRFEYCDPTFDPSLEFIIAMREYAYDQVGKHYDVLQLASYCVNLIIWIVWPRSWGEEVLKWFNKPGGYECCSSGVPACLRYAEPKRKLEISIDANLSQPNQNILTDKEIQKFQTLLNRIGSRFFKGYDTAMVPPCLFELDKNWRGNEFHE